MSERGYMCEIYERQDGSFDWRLVASNGQIVGTSGSQGYVSEKTCEAMARNVFAGADNVTLAFEASQPAER